MLIECGDQICFEEGADAKVLLPETHRAVTPPQPPVEPPHAWPMAATPMAGGNAALPGRTRARSPPRVCRARGRPAPANSAGSLRAQGCAARIGPCQGTWDSTRGAGSVPTDASSWRDCGVQHHPGDVHLLRGLCTPPSMPPIPPT